MADRENGFDTVASQSLEIATRDDIQILASLAIGVFASGRHIAKPLPYHYSYTGAECWQYRWKDTLVTGVVYQPTKQFPDVRIYTEDPIGEPLESGNQIVRVGATHLNNRALVRSRSSYVAEVKQTEYRLETAKASEPIGQGACPPKYEKLFPLSRPTKQQRAVFKGMTAFENDKAVRRPLMFQLKYLLEAAPTVRPLPAKDKQEN